MAEKPDMHPAKIKAELAVRGWTLSSIARHHGFAITTPHNVLRRPYPRIERIVASIIGKKPQEIWPSRYAREQPKQAA